MDELEKFLKEEHVKTVLTSEKFKNRMEKLGIEKYVYENEINNALMNNTLETGKSYSETINNFEEHLKWKMFCSYMTDKANRIIWGGIGAMTTAMASFPLFSYAVTKMKVTERFNLSEKDLILLFSASALAEFFVLKRAGYRIIKKSEEKYEKETLKPNNNNGSLYSDMLKTRDEKNKAHENNYSK